MSAEADGRIVTFYSYKGGTGRSMALANVAWILAAGGYRVLAVDWDLEAPGLHRYFYPFLRDKDLASTDGLMDLVLKYAAAAVTQPPTEGLARDWHRPYADVLRYAFSLDWPFSGGGSLDLLCAGRQDASYAVKVNTFDWLTLYQKRGGFEFFEMVKQSMRGAYDYVLIDSRTGVSDTSGICTVQMPDIVVLCFTLNHQSVEGASNVCRSILEARRENRPLVLPVPMRIELGETDTLNRRRSYAWTRFAALPNFEDDAVRKWDVRGYWAENADSYRGRSEVLYIPYYAYEEILAPFVDKPGHSSTVLAAAESLTAFVSAGAVTRSPAVDDATRDRVRLQYQRRGLADVPESEIGKRAEEAFLKLTPDDQRLAQRVFLCLVRVTRSDQADPDTPTRVTIADLGAPAVLLQQLATSGLVRIDNDSSLGDVVQVGSPAMLTRWDRYRGWIDADREFLLWRQQMDSAIAAWEGSERDADALLAGTQLEAAITWVEKRSDHLTAAERAYVEASVRARDEMRRSAEREQDRQRREREERIARLAELNRAHSAKAIEALESKVQRARRRAITAVVIVLAGLAILLPTLQRRKQDEAQRRTAVETYIYLARAGLAVDSLDAALRFADSALALDERSAAGFRVRGMILTEQGKLPEAITSLSQSIQLDSTDGSTFNARATVRVQQGDIGGALVDLQRAVALDPGNAQWQLTIGQLYERLGRPADAQSAYESALGLSKRVSDQRAEAEALYNLGVAAENAAQRDSAIAYYRAVIAAVPDTADPPLVYTAARARLDRLAPRPVQAAGSIARRPAIALHYLSPNDEAAAREIMSTLRARGLPVTGVEQRPEPTDGDVRYFNGADESLANRVREATQEALAQRGIFLKLRVFRPDVTRYRDVRPGSVEVWLPALDRYAPAVTK